MRVARRCLPPTPPPMGHRGLLLPLLLAALCISLSGGAAEARGHGSRKSYEAIFSFGDSLSDAGNLIVNGTPKALTTARAPYGITFFGRPTGRCSNGRVVVDFLAEHFGLPLPPASQAHGKDFKKGANFAITGATALDYSFFKAHGIDQRIWNTGSIITQIGWLQKMKPSLCKSEKECKDYFSKSLFVVGEFGGNDYNAPLFSGVAFSDVKTYVPLVAKAIANGVEEVIIEDSHVAKIGIWLPRMQLPLRSIEEVRQELLRQQARWNRVVELKNIEAGLGFQSWINTDSTEITMLPKTYALHMQHYPDDAEFVNTRIKHFAWLKKIFGPVRGGLYRPNTYADALAEAAYDEYDDDDFLPAPVKSKGKSAASSKAKSNAASSSGKR